MGGELRLDLVFQMAQAIDKLLLSWEPKPNLNEAISAQVQSLARALAATTDPGLSLTTVKDGLERILPEIVRTTSRSEGEECGRPSRYPLDRLIAKAGAAPRSVAKGMFDMPRDGAATDRTERT